MISEEVMINIISKLQNGGFQQATDELKNTGNQTNTLSNTFA